MSSSPRLPGSREEDAWLSDDQLEKCAPAEIEPFQSPVPTRMISNGEYMPHPQTEQQRHVEFRIKELAESAAKKLGISRRQFLESTGGLAASFIAINEAFGKPFFKVSPVAYKQGNLAQYALAMTPGSPIDNVLNGPGYPTPIMPASLLPDDNFSKMKKQYAEMELGRSNTRFGWLRTRS